MVNLTTYHETVIMDRSFRGVDAPPAPQTLYVALHTAHPTNTGRENEVTAADYARQPIAATSWAGTGGAVENATVVDFGTAGSLWGEIRFMSLWDGDLAATGANALWYAELGTYKGPIEAGDSLRFNLGTLTFEVG